MRFRYFALVGVMALLALSFCLTGCGESPPDEAPHADLETEDWAGIRSALDTKWKADAEKSDEAYFTIAEGEPYYRPYQLQGDEEAELLDATAAQITFASGWVRKHCPVIAIGPSYHMNYLHEWSMRLPPGAKGQERITQRLDHAIRELHRKVGNADAEECNIIIGNGATHVISSIMWAHSDAPTHVCVKAPAWCKFDKIWKHIPNMKWDASCYEGKVEADENERRLQFVTIPNNPDGNLDDTPPFEGAPTVYDMVYYWPSCVFGKHKIEKRDFDIMVFSLSKLIGYAATRFGWALVRDEDVARRMAEYISNTQLNISVDAQLRAIYALESLSERIGTEDDFFVFASDELQRRWRRIERVFEDKPEWEIENVERLGYILWLRAKAGNAYELLKEVGVEAEEGAEFYNVGKAISDHYVRVDMGQEPVVFDELIRRLGAL